MIALAALLGFTVTIVLVQDRLAVVITSVPAAVFWSAWMIWMLPRIANAAPPLRVRLDQLPPAVGIWKVITISSVSSVIAEVVVVGIAVSTHEYVALGFMLGTPAVIWNSARKTERTERDLGSTLWRTAKFAWSSKDTRRYLVTGEDA